MFLIEWHARKLTQRHCGRVLLCWIVLYCKQKPSCVTRCCTLWHWHKQCKEQEFSIYLMMSVTHILWRQMVWWLMNWKGFGTEMSWHNWGAVWNWAVMMQLRCNLERRGHGAVEVQFRHSCCRAEGKGERLQIFHAPTELRPSISRTQI